MAKREDIETSIYSDPDFLSLAGSARWVYVWSFTNPRAGMSGIYKVAPEQVAMETGYAGKQLERALAELREKRFLFYDGRVMFVRTKVKRSRTKSESIAKSIKGDVEALGEHPFVEMWWQQNENQGWVTRHMTKPDFTGDSEGSTTTPPGPPEGSHVNGKGKVTVPVTDGAEEQQPEREQLPGDFPDEIRPHLDAVVPVLQEMAARHHAKAVTRYQVAMTIKARPCKPLVKAAHDCAGHWEGKQLSNVNAAYRNWLDKCEDLAAIEAVGATVHSLPAGSRFAEYDTAAGL